MSLLLDVRQRAMLAEMGVQVWMPLPRAQQAPAFLAAEKQAVESVAVAGAGMAPPAARQPARQTQTQTQTQTRLQPDARPPVAARAAPMPAIHPSMDLPALREAASQCRACPLCANRTHTVWDAPPPAAPDLPRWLFVLDAPGAAENATGQPAQGEPGQLLAHMVAALRLQAPQIYRAHVTKCAVLAGQTVGQAEIGPCASWLCHEIARVRPQVIVALGRQAAFSLLGSTQPLGALRGQMHRVQLGPEDAALQNALQDVPVLVSYPLAYLLRTPAAKAQAWADLCLAHSWVSAPSPRAS